MTDLRDLCARMADELDRYRQYLMDDRSEVHALAAEARAALVESKSIEDRIAEADAAIEASIERVRRIASMPAREIAAEFRDRTALAEPERLTVEEISDLPKHGENYIYEGRNDKIQLDGDFSRADLQQLANSIPNNRSNSK